LTATAGNFGGAFAFVVFGAFVLGLFTAFAFATAAR
jgi:hypothetical protein